jgi:hypothetical protein
MELVFLKSINSYLSGLGKSFADFAVATSIASSDQISNAARLKECGETGTGIELFDVLKQMDFYIIDEA